MFHNCIKNAKCPYKINKLVGNVKCYRYMDIILIKNEIIVKNEINETTTLIQKQERKVTQL